VDHEPPVRIFVMGENVWRDYLDWPPPEARAHRLMLGSSGNATGSWFAGSMSDAPARAPSLDIIRHDPADPLPTLGGATLLNGATAGARSGPVDLRSIVGRADVAAYATPVLTEPLDAIGPVQLALHVSVDGPDADVSARLVDIEPDGRVTLVTDGILRLRYREGRGSPAPMRPGVSVSVWVDLAPTAWRFAPGHRIGLLVTGSDFPRYDLLPGPGAGPVRIGVHLGPETPGVLHLSVVPIDRESPPRSSLPVQSRMPSGS